MKAKPLKLVEGEWKECDPKEATHLKLNLPGPSGILHLPVMIGGTRSGTGNWTWNGSVESPTVKPSILSTHGHFMEGHQGTCWCDYNREHPDEPKKFFCFRCHTWVNDGKVQFLPDCSHELKNQTVDLLDID